jgi:hypothetical protein
MVQGGSFQGRSILTPKPKPTSKPTARRTGNWQPSRREDRPEHKHSDSAALSPSEAQRDRMRGTVPPSGALAGTIPNRTRSQPAGKGKGPTTSLNNAPPPTLQVRPSFPDRSLLPRSSASERAFLPGPRPRTSEVGSVSKPARGTANHYQAEADQIEKEQDADDASFADSQPQSLTANSSVVDSLSQLGLSQELSQETLRINRQHAESPGDQTGTLPVQSERRPTGSLLEAQAEPLVVHKKRTAHQIAAEAQLQPTRQSRIVHQTAIAVQPTQQQKRPVSQPPTSEETPAKRKQTYQQIHRNQRYATLKPASQAKRKQAIKGLKAVWKITDAALMALPFAPCRTTGPEQGVMQPLDWNTLLVEALVLLARATRGDFVSACEVAREAFEKESLFSGATQLNAEIVASALERLREDGVGSQASQRAVVPGGMQRADAVVPPIAGPSASGQHAPPSLSASPAMSPTVPIKTESGNFGPRRSTSALDEVSSGAEDIDILEAKVRLRKIEYELACEKVAFSELRRKKSQRGLERLRGHGSSAEDALYF